MDGQSITVQCAYISERSDIRRVVDAVQGAALSARIRRHVYYASSNLSTLHIKDV